MQQATKETIAEFLKKVAAKSKDESLAFSPNVRASVYRMLQAVYANQTADEQNAQTTAHRNGKGFTGVDAQILSDIAQSSQRYQNLTGPQARFVAKKLVKYAGQILAAKGTHSAQAQSEPAAAPVYTAEAAETAQDARKSNSPARMSAARKIYATKDETGATNVFGQVEVVTKKRTKKTPWVLVDGVNTASELAFFAALDALPVAPRPCRNVA